ncbi:MAG: hypothetical protein ABIH18_05250 [Candidatus Omnitrophota bacterium]
MAFVARTGCSLPSLMILNFIFGWIFLRPAYWIVLEVVLLGLFILNIVFLKNKLFSAFNTTPKDTPRGKKSGNIVDIEGEVLE